MAERDEESVAVCNTDGRTEDHSLCPRGLRAPEPTGGEREEEGGALQCVHKDYGEDGKPTEHARLRPIRLRTIRLRPISRSRNWPKSKLAEVEIGRSRNWPKSKLAEVEQMVFALFLLFHFLFLCLFFFFFPFPFFLLSHHTLHFLFVLLLLLSPPGLHTTARELQTCTFQGRRFKHHPNSTKGPQREGEKKENCGGRGQKKREILGTHPSGHHPFGAPPFGAPLFLGLGFHPSGPRALGGPKIQHPKIDRSRNWPKSKLAEVEIGRSRN